MSDLSLKEAIQYSNLGLYVVPIIPGLKRPAMEAWQDCATNDTNMINHWWTQQYVGYGVGIAPRQLPDGRWLFIIDVDEKPEASGSETLQELIDAYGPLPECPIAHSGSGIGQHLYFAAPYEIRNGKTGRLGPGIDIRGNGGQVCASPTIHKTGNKYTWDLEYNLDTTPIPDAPGWLLQLLNPPEPIQTTSIYKTTIWDQIRNSPADIYNQENTWEEILINDGWTYSHSSPDGEQHWTRPGKTSKDGTSATTGYKNLDILKVFTTSLKWLPEGTYSKFKYYAHSKHQGDMSQAAKTILKEQPTAAPMVAVDPTEPWQQPITFTNTVKTPQFPAHTLPPWITNYTKQIAQDIQVTHDLPATLAIGALSVIALGNTKILYPRTRWNQPLNIYAAVSLPPSAGKSPAKNAIFRPLEQYETQRIINSNLQKQINESERRTLEKRLKDLEDKKARATGPTDEHSTHIYQTIHEIANTHKTPSGRLLVDDATTEALGVALHEAGGSIAVISAEGGLFDRIAGMYNETANLDLYLEGWSGGRYIVDRIKRDSIQIESANLVVITTIQPTTLDEIGAKKTFAGRGLTARFLLTIPTSNVGTRDRLKTTDIDLDTEQLYNNTITELANRYHSTQTQLTIDQEASDIYANWDQNLENQLGPDMPLEHLAEWVGKLRATTLRLAGLLHIGWKQPGHNIDKQTMQHAITLANYYLDHMTAISERWGVDETTAKAKKISNWLARKQIKTITIRDLMRHQRRLLNSSEETLPILHLLIDKGHIRPTFDGPILLGQRGKTPQEFAVNPYICDESQMSPHVTRQDESGLNVAHVNTQNDREHPEPVDNHLQPVDNHYQMSRMSRMSPKGGFEYPHSKKENKPQSHPPVDIGDMDDISINLDNLI
jgi:hypothetical protein